MKKTLVIGAIVCMFLLIFFILSRILFFQVAAMAMIKVGEGSPRVSIEFGPGRQLHAPDGVILEQNRIYIRELCVDGSVIKQYRRDGAYISSFTLSNAGTSELAGTMGVDNSGNIYVESLPEESMGTNIPQGFSSLLRFDSTGRLMKNVVLFEGRIMNIRFNNYNYMTLVIRDGAGRFHVERFAGDIMVLSAVFSNESPDKNTGMRVQLENVFPVMNDAEAVLEFKCYDGKKGGYLYTRLVAYDLLQQRFLPTLFTMDDEPAELFAVDKNNRLYFTSYAASSLLKLSIRDLEGRIIKNKFWDVHFRTLSGYLLFPFIAADGSICQVRVDRRFFRLLWYK